MKRVLYYQPFIAEIEGEKKVRSPPAAKRPIALTPAPTAAR